MGSSYRRRILAVLLVGVVSSSSCHAFKPSRSGILPINRGAAAAIDNDESVGIELLKNGASISSAGEAGIGRGGHCPEDEGKFHLHRSDVLRSHGCLLIFLAVTCFLETVGVILPLVGPSALIPGFDPNDGATKFVARFSCVVMLSRGLMEIEFATSKAAQDIFIRIVSSMQVVTLWTMIEISAKGIQWLVPALPAAYIIGFVVGKD